MGASQLYLELNISLLYFTSYQQVVWEKRLSRNSPIWIDGERKDRFCINQLYPVSLRTRTAGMSPAISNAWAAESTGHLEKKFADNETARAKTLSSYRNIWLFIKYLLAECMPVIELDTERMSRGRRLLCMPGTHCHLGTQSMHGARKQNMQDEWWRH